MGSRVCGWVHECLQAVISSESCAPRKTERRQGGDGEAEDSAVCPDPGQALAAMLQLGVGRVGGGVTRKMVVMTLGPTRAGLPTSPLLRSQSP